MKEETRCLVAGEVHLYSAGIAFASQRNLKITYHPRFLTWFSHQSQRPAFSTNSIKSETVIRVANSDRMAYLAVGLKVAPAQSAHQLNIAQNRIHIRCSNTVHARSFAPEEISDPKWQNN
ncbi:MAG: hypothetical protein DMF69_10110 [Acidobacteria bacterium]|nr:MAG: hypothetical protein DMF69_10110 [Acidobacteriota bacterium]